MSSEPCKTVINVTVLSDFICPWCYVAKRNFDKAVQLAKDRYTVNVSFEPFLLKPNIPPEGMDKPALEEGKPRVSAQIKAAGEAVDIDFTGKADRYPYTVTAHALVDYAAKFNKQVELSEALFKAYFTDGIFLDVDRLVGYAELVGLPADECRQVITDPKTLDNITSRARAWRTKDVRGVPCFFMNGVKTLSGNETPEHFVNMFDVVAQNYPQ